MRDAAAGGSSGHERAVGQLPGSDEQEQKEPNAQPEPGGSVPDSDEAAGDHLQTERENGCAEVTAWAPRRKHEVAGQQRDA